MKFGLLSTASIAASLLLSGSAWAGTDTTTFAVGVNVINSCTLSDAGDIAFGDVNLEDVSSTSTITSGSVTVTCNGSTSSGLSYTLSPSGGNSDDTGRYMTNTTNAESDSKVYYELCTDSQCGTVWSSTNTISSDDASSGVSTYYAELLKADNSSADVGSYSDTVTITVTYSDGDSD